MNDRDARDHGAALGPPPDLVDSILERTSRSPCERTQNRLCDFIDGSLGAAGASQVRRHLSACRECRSLAAALTALAEDLPAASLPWQQRLTRGWDRLVRGWTPLLRRPRFTLEAAYVATMVLAVIFISPVSPFRGVSAHALSAVRVDPTAALSHVTDPVATLSSRIGHLGHRAWMGIAAKAQDSFRGLETELANRQRRVGEAAQDLSRHGAELRDAALDLAPEEASGALKRMTTDLGAIWRRIISGHQEEISKPTSNDSETEPRRTS